MKFVRLICILPAGEANTAVNPANVVRIQEGKDGGPAIIFLSAGEPIKVKEAYGTALYNLENA